MEEFTTDGGILQPNHPTHSELVSLTLHAGHQSAEELASECWTCRETTTTLLYLQRVTDNQIAQIVQHVG